MKWLKQYLSDFFDTLSSPQYYRQLIKTSWWRSVKFFIISYLLLSLLAAARFNTKTIPQYEDSISKGLADLQQYYPVELLLTWDGQRLTSNTDQPLALDYPRDLTKPADFPVKLATYVPNDVTDPVQTAATLPHSTLFLVTPTQLFVNTLSADWNSLPLSEIPGFEQPFSISAASLPDYIHRWQQQLQDQLTTLQLWTTLLFVIGLPLLRLWGTILNSLLGWFMFRTLDRPLPYKKVLQLALHVSVAAEVVAQLSGWLTPDLSLSMYTLTYWVLGGLVFVSVLKALRYRSGTNS